MDTSLVQKIRSALRISTSAYDAEISDLLDATKVDLQIAGINADFSNPLVLRAATVYCKANFGSNPDSERLQQSYESLKTYMSLDDDFLSQGA